MKIFPKFLASDHLAGEYKPKGKMHSKIKKSKQHREKVA